MGCDHGYVDSGACTDCIAEREERICDALERIADALEAMVKK